MFEKEMNQLTKTIHTLQGDTQHDVAGNTDYQVRGPQLRRGGRRLAANSAPCRMVMRCPMLPTV